MSAQFFEGAGARDVYLAFAITLFFSHYAVPCACFFILYGMVVISMQRRKRDSQFESNRYITLYQHILHISCCRYVSLFSTAWLRSVCRGENETHSLSQTGNLPLWSSWLTGKYLLHISLFATAWLRSVCRGENETQSLEPKIIYMLILHVLKNIKGRLSSA